MKLEKLKGLLVELEQDELFDVNGGFPCCPQFPGWCPHNPRPELPINPGVPGAPGGC